MPLQRTHKIILLTILLPTIILSAFWFLSKVFQGAIILPQVFHLGPLSIHYYGLIMALAVLAGVLLAQVRMHRYRVSDRQAEVIYTYIVIGGFIGARLYHVLTSWDYYEKSPLQILFVWQGGLSIYGAIIGGIVGLYLCLKNYHSELKLLSLLDWLAPSVAAGQAIGRFGNLFNYEAYGIPSSLPWKMFVPEIFRPAFLVNTQYFTPTFLYESIGLIVITFTLLKLSESRIKTGTLFLYLLLMYNTMRIFTEKLRIDSVIIGNIRINMAFSIIICIGAILGLSFIYGQKNTRNN